MEGAPDIIALNEEIKNESAFVDLLKSELSKVIVGQDGMVEGLLIRLLAKSRPFMLIGGTIRISVTLIGFTSQAKRNLKIEWIS